jgi:hypothetical protein
LSAGTEQSLKGTKESLNEQFPLRKARPQGGFALDLDFQKNLSTNDRIIRVAIGLLAMALVFARLTPGLWAGAAIVFALFQFVEAALGY